MTACRGGCHCGAVQYEVMLPDCVEAYRCNCSICSKCGFVHVFTTPERFRLLQGGDALIEYRFNTRAARHLFCRHCGVKSYYVPRSHPDGFSVNLNCLDVPGNIIVTVGDFDGRHWTRSIGKLRGEGRATE